MKLPLLYVIGCALFILSVRASYKCPEYEYDDTNKEHKKKDTEHNCDSTDNTCSM